MNTHWGWNSRLGRGWGVEGVAPATMNVIPAYFCRKKEEKYNQKKSLAV